LVAQGPTFQLFRALDRQRYAEFEVLDRRSGAEFEALGQRPAAEIMLKELPARAQLPAPGQRQLLDGCLRREAGLLARLRHPSIVRLLEAGEWQRSGEAFYAMADVKGESLREAVGRARQPHQRLGLLRAFVGVADAIEYAHARGLLHRNVNPSAIVYDRGRAWATLVDWSAAKPLHRRSPRDAVFDAAELPTGGPNTAARGTIGFAAPEQASPEQDQRTDVYSLGATLHFIVTGRLPCSHNGRDSFIAKIHDDCRDESVGLPEGLSSIVTKAMAYEPADRHESAHEFVSELRRALGL
jgi:eukaryotic-like serine/threonine-protein kinase